MGGVSIGSLKQVGVTRSDEAVAAMSNNKVLKTGHQRTSRKCNKSIAFRKIIISKSIDHVQSLLLKDLYFQKDLS